MDYKNGKVYRLVSSTTGKHYVGSTTQPLHKRFYYHKKDYMMWKEGKREYLTSFDLFEEGEVEVFLVEDFPCERKEQLHARERHWIETLECVNKKLPTRTKKEYYQDNRDKILSQREKYREENKEKVKECKRSHYQQNRECVLAKQKEYRDNHTEKIREYNQSERRKQGQQEWLEKNWDKVLERAREKVLCECGFEGSVSHLSRHRKSTKHQEWERTKH